MLALALFCAFIHFIKQTLQARAYLRYVDDLILLADDKTRLHQWQQCIAEYLQGLRLVIHPAKANIYQVYEGVDVLGYRVFPAFRQLRNDNGFRFARTLRHYGSAGAFEQEYTV